jgi:hypothetical protein
MFFHCDYIFVPLPRFVQIGTFQLSHQRLRGVFANRYILFGSETVDIIMILFGSGIKLFMYPSPFPASSSLFLIIALGVALAIHHRAMSR